MRGATRNNTGIRISAETLEERTLGLWRNLCCDWAEGFWPVCSWRTSADKGPDGDSDDDENVQSVEDYDGLFVEYT